MEENIISRTAAETAIKASENALSENSLHWIRESVLLERVYLMGLYFGLKAVASEESLKRLEISLLKSLISEVRSGDDTFSGTTIGNEFLLLEKACQDNSEYTNLKNRARGLHIIIEKYDRHWRQIVVDGHKMIERLITIKNCDAEFDSPKDFEHSHEFYQEYHTVIEALGKICRKLALLENDHLLNQRFK